MGMKMLNGIVSFTGDNDSENELSEASRAELYTRIYKWAAEDFTSVADQKAFIEDLLKWARSVEKRLTKLGYNLASHTHPVLPHWHVGSGPQVGGQTTLMPKSADRLRWPTEPMFKMIQNTTGARSNFKENKIIDNRTPKIGDAEFGKTGRQMTIPILKNKNFNKVIIKS